MKKRILTLDDTWKGDMYYHPTSGTFSVNWTDMTPKYGPKPEKRGIAQSWLQFESVLDHVDGGAKVRFNKTTLYV
jgi:hypothetical protein